MAIITGKVHSFETCGMVDGPGVRFVVFLQGCPSRCIYCHNPDTWSSQGGQVMTSEAVVEEANKYRTWMIASGGGITISGGEALFQPEFTLDIIRRAHSKKMRVALDTSACVDLSKSKECLDEADLIILDIKTAQPDAYKTVAGSSADHPFATLEYLKKINKPMWIRHVVVPGFTDNKNNLDALKEILQNIPSLERFEFLPFHKMGEEKWQQLGTPYTLANTQPPAKEFINIISREFSEAGIPMSENFEASSLESLLQGSSVSQPLQEFDHFLNNVAEAAALNSNAML